MQSCGFVIALSLETSLTSYIIFTRAVVKRNSLIELRYYGFFNERNVKVNICSLFNVHLIAF